MKLVSGNYIVKTEERFPSVTPYNIHSITVE